MDTKAAHAAHGDEMMDDARSYLVLGAGGGIGSALCRRLRADGATLLALGRDHERLEELGKELDIETLRTDARNTRQVEAAMERARERFGRLDGVANCVGSLLLKPAHLTSDEEWAETLATNLGSGFAVVKAAGRQLRPDGGSVVLMASAAAELGLANHEAIAAAKAGLVGLMKAAAATYAPNRIRFNCVAPGLVETPLTARLTANETSRKASTALHALGRLGQPEEVASAIAWLLSPEQGWVTGQVLGVDGGLAHLRARG